MLFRSSSKLRTQFNESPEAKQKFLKLTGFLLDVGQKLKYNSIGISDSHYNLIKEYSGCDNLSKEEINKIAQKTYSVLETGLWAYKNTVNKDKYCKKEDYCKTNICSWIKELKIGKNNIYNLALLSPNEASEYAKASDIRKEEIEKKHITIHHKIALKYHNILSGEDKNALKIGRAHV